MQTLYTALIMGVGIGLHCMYHYDTGNVIVTTLCATLFALPVAALMQLAISIVFYSYTTFALFLLWWVVVSLLITLLHEESRAPAEKLYICACAAAVLVWLIYCAACGGFHLALRGWNAVRPLVQIIYGLYEVQILKV